MRAFDKKFPHAKADMKAFVEYTEGAPLAPFLKLASIPLPPKPAEIRKIRATLKFSQAQMAAVLQTPKKTYQNWEQGLRVPMGAVGLLLRLLKKNPMMVKELLAV